jgi:putative transcriptional regulator
MESLKGHLLVASPHLLDPNFVHTVVLLIHHSEEGAFGVVLNRPADNTIKDLWEQVGDGPCESDRRVNVGGPVAGPLMAIHTDQHLAEMEILPGVYFAAQRDHLETLLRQSGRPFRVFIGHSGWGGGQLEHELEEGAWLTTPASPDQVFDDDDADLWKKVAQHIGESMLASSLGIKHVPKDPTVN